MKVILNIFYSSGETEKIEFNKYDTFVVGRSKTNTHSQLKGDRYISRHHFILEVNPPDCFLKDLGSTNGTKINGLLLSKGETRKLSAGDEIYVGRTTLRIDIKGELDILLKAAEIPCAECDKPLNTGLTDEIPQESKEINYSKESSDSISLPLAETNKDYREIIKKEINKWRNKINIDRINLPVEKKFKEEILCHGCSKIMTDIACKDGKGNILKDSTLYFCPDCRPEGDKNLKCNKIENYHLIKLIASGGMGKIYKAWHTLTGRIVVIKKISSHIVMNEKIYKLFQREIDVMSSLNHPNIVHLYEHGRTGNSHYFATEFMNGGDAGDLVRKKLAPLPYKLACYIICQVLTALEFAHSQNYIHRDIKPENILLNRDTHSMKAKLSDFGLAKNFQDAGNSMLTQEKEFMGTLLFMPPEQLRNYRYVKPPTDIYSTGATLYYLLTGKYIFDYPSPLDILLAEQKGKKINLNQYDDPFLMILETSPVPVEKHTNNIPDRLIRVVNKSILKNEKNRYLSAKEFKEDIIKSINDL